MVAAGVEKEPAALYVHWPWCVRKCPYCDFNSFACAGKIPEGAYIDALLKDLTHAVKDLAGRPVATVFFGGGTPSLMSAAGFTLLMDGIRNRVTLLPDAEVTLEANPGTVEAARFEAYAKAGVNRFSIGIQSFNDSYLAKLGRIHTGAEALHAVKAARDVVENINLDVMFALPGQTVDELKADLETALSQNTTHLSFYELTIEEGTAFGKRPPAGLPDGDRAADMGQLVHETLTGAGFSHYEISGYARPGRRCRHNLTYWTFGDYLGIGAGAHGKVTREGAVIRTVRESNPLLYIQSVLEGRSEKERRTVAREDLPFEFMLNALRLTDGVPAQRWTQTTGRPLTDIAATLTALRKEKVLTDDIGRIAATELGRRFLSDVQERFLEE